MAKHKYQTTIVLEYKAESDEAASAIAFHAADAIHENCDHIMAHVRKPTRKKSK